MGPFLEAPEEAFCERSNVVFPSFLFFRWPLSVVWRWINWTMEVKAIGRLLSLSVRPSILVFSVRTELATMTRRQQLSWKRDKK